MYWSYPILPFGIVACTFFPTTFLETAVYKNYKIRRCGSTNRYWTYPNLLKRLKKVEKLHRLKSRPIFSECCEAFDFPTGISGFLYVNGKYPMASLSLRPSLPRLLSRTTRAFLVTIFPEWRALSQDSPRRHHWFPHEMTSEKRA